MRFQPALIGAVALATSTLAQTSSYCPGNNVCYAVNIPSSSASSGSGDIYFQITGPSTMSWIGLGQGTQMAGSNIFMIYADSAGTNVTLSPRLGTGERQPESDTSAQVTLLDGSGVSDGVMTANVKCSNCNSWSGGSMSFTDTSSDWIWAYKVGSAIDSDDVSASVSQHTTMGTTNFNLVSATGGDSTNPFTTSSAATSSNSTTSGSSSSSSGATGSSSSSTPSNFNTVRLAHAIIGPIAFALFFPLGAIAIRAFSVPGLVWMHAGWMMFTYLLIVIAMSLGIYLGVKSDQIDTYHAIIGLIVVCGLILQPITGLLHHSLFKARGRPNVATYPHIWWGRIFITLGIINGGLGLRLTGNTRNGEIAYGVVAGLIWITWMIVLTLAFFKSRKTPEGETGEKLFGSSSHEGLRKEPQTRSYNGSE